MVSPKGAVNAALIVAEAAATASVASSVIGTPALEASAETTSILVYATVVRCSCVRCSCDSDSDEDIWCSSCSWRSCRSSWTLVAVEAAAAAATAGSVPVVSALGRSAMPSPSLG